jgi:hypothetical protein
MKHIVVKLLALIALACSLATTARAESFAKRVDIGGGRMMYIECHGGGSPTVLLISGTDTASDLWHAADQKGPTVYDDIQKTTRVCAYAPVVIQAIRMVVDAVRAGQTSLKR